MGRSSPYLIVNRYVVLDSIRSDLPFRAPAYGGNCSSRQRAKNLQTTVRISPRGTTVNLSSGISRLKKKAPAHLLAVFLLEKINHPT